MTFGCPARPREQASPSSCSLNWYFARRLLSQNCRWALSLLLLWQPGTCSAAIISAPIEAVRQGSYLGLLFVPIGFGVGYLLFRVSNWLVYGLLNFEPWAYNFFF